MKRLTPLSLVIIAFVCIVAGAIGFSAVVTASCENPMQIFTDRSTADKTVEIWFPELYGQGGAGIGNDTEFRVATIIGSEKAVTVVCPGHFVPYVSQVYLANERRLETSDGRLAPPVWTLIVDLDGRAILPRH